MKAVEVCYWSCKFRKNCKDWEGALVEIPGTDAIRERLAAAAKKSGRAFNPADLVTQKKNKTSHSLSIPISPAGAAQSRDASAAQAKAHPKLPKGFQREQSTPYQIRNFHGRSEEPMLNTAAEEITEPGAQIREGEKSTPGADKTAAPKAKTKAAVKPKPVNNNGPVYLLLFANGKYKELKESELNAEAAGVVKDQTLRLVKGQFLVPQISFKVADE